MENNPVPAILETAAAGALAAIDDYEYAAIDLVEAVSAIGYAYEDAWEALYQQTPIVGLLEMTAAWKGFLDQLLTPKDRTEKWFALPAANYHWRLGRALMDPKRYEEAETEFTLALEAYESAYDVPPVGTQFLKRLHEWRGLCRANLGNLAAAKADFLQQLTIEWLLPGKVQILRALAAIDWQQGEKQSAVARIEEAIRLVDAAENVDADLHFHLAKELDDLRAQL